MWWYTIDTHKSHAHSSVMYLQRQHTCLNPLMLCSLKHSMRQCTCHLRNAVCCLQYCCKLPRRPSLPLPYGPVLHGGGGGGWARMGEGTISPRPYASRSATIFMLKTTRIPSEKSGSTSHDVITCIIFLPSNVHSCSDQVGYMKVTSTLWCVKLYTLLGSALVQNSRCHHHNHDALLSVQK